MTTNSALATVEHSDLIVSSDLEPKADRFNDYLQRAIDESNVGFDIDLKPKAWNGKRISIAGLSIPVFNELLVREAWFEGYVNRQLLKITQSVDSGAFPELLDKLAEYMKFSGPEEAFRFIRGEKTEQQVAAFNLFATYNSQLMARVNLANSIGGEQFILALRITFFIRSRCDANYGFSQAMELLSGEMQELVDFIQLEANKGIPLKATADEATTPDPADKAKK